MFTEVLCSLLHFVPFTFNILKNSYQFLVICQDAMSDLTKAHEVSPDDETIENVLRYCSLLWILQRNFFFTPYL